MTVILNNLHRKPTINDMKHYFVFEANYIGYKEDCWPSSFWSTVTNRKKEKSEWFDLIQWYATFFYSISFIHYT